jgi:hypothetical protein
MAARFASLLTSGVNRHSSVHRSSNNCEIANLDREMAARFASLLTSGVNRHS